MFDWSSIELLAVSRFYIFVSILCSAGHFSPPIFDNNFKSILIFLNCNSCYPLRVPPHPTSAFRDFDNELVYFFNFQNHIVSRLARSLLLLSLSCLSVILSCHLTPSSEKRVRSHEKGFRSLKKGVQSLKKRLRSLKRRSRTLASLV